MGQILLLQIHAVHDALVASFIDKMEARKSFPWGRGWVGKMRTHAAISRKLEHSFDGTNNFISLKIRVSW